MNLKIVLIVCAMLIAIPMIQYQFKPKHPPLENVNTASAPSQGEEEETISISEIPKVIAPELGSPAALQQARDKEKETAKNDQPTYEEPLPTNILVQ